MTFNYANFMRYTPEEFDIKYIEKNAGISIEEIQRRMVECKIGDYNNFMYYANLMFPFLNNSFYVLQNSSKALNTPTLDNVDLAVKGLHTFRKYIAHLAHSKKTTIVTDAVVQYNTVGNVIVENFLNIEPDGIKRIVDEFERVSFSNNKQFYNTIFYNKEKYPNTFVVLKEIKEWLRENLSFTHFSYGEWDKKLNKNTFMQRLNIKADDGDHQKDWHLDTFFPALKLWWFPEPVSLETGPFWYADNSAMWERLSAWNWYYNESVKCCDGTYNYKDNKDTIEGSFRIPEFEISNLQFVPRPVTVPGNTLVVANVSGFHRRGDVEKESIRNAVHSSVRVDNPGLF
jgi:hypothetical protein